MTAPAVVPTGGVAAAVALILGTQLMTDRYAPKEPTFWGSAEASRVLIGCRRHGFFVTVGALFPLHAALVSAARRSCFRCTPLWAIHKAKRLNWSA